MPLNQPWATLVAIGAKRIETRDFAPSKFGLRVGERIAIYATKGPGDQGERGLRAQCEAAAFARALRGFGFGTGAGLDPLPRGAVVCTCVLVRAAEMEAAKIETLRTTQPDEYAFGHYAPGRWAWVLRDVKLLEPPVSATEEAASGRGGAFEWDENQPVQEVLK